MPFRFLSFGWDSFWFVWRILYFHCLGFDGFWLCFGQLGMVHKTWDDGEGQNCCQDYKTFISAFDYKQVCHNQGSPRSEENLYISQWRSSWISTEKLKTRTNAMYVMADIWESVLDSVKLKPCHDKNRICISGRGVISCAAYLPSSGPSPSRRRSLTSSPTPMEETRSAWSSLTMWLK